MLMKTIKHIYECVWVQIQISVETVETRSAHLNSLVSDLFWTRCRIQDLSESLSRLEPDHIHNEPLGAGERKETQRCEKQTNV